MVSMGKPYPRYRSFNDAVSLTIFSAIDNTEFVKFITEVQDKNSKIMPLAEMMILRDLMDNRRLILMKLMDCVKKECKFVEVAFKDWSDKMEDLIFVLCCLVIYIVYQLVPYKSEVTMVLIYGIGLEVTFRLISKYRARHARKEGQGDTKKDEERVE